LSANTRKVVLAVHIVAAGSWIGIDVVLAVFVFTAILTDDPSTAALAYRGLGLFAIWPLLGAGVLSLLTGLALGLGSKYGLVKYWWVAIKLVLNLLLSGLVLIALVPVVDAATAYGDQLVNGTPSGPPPAVLLYPPIVSPIALLFAVYLAVFKPWGRFRKSGTAT
jgi:uncharacterized membrane protein